MWIKIRGFSGREKELGLDLEESSGTIWRRDQRGGGRVKYSSEDFLNHSSKYLKLVLRQ